MGMKSQIRALNQAGDEVSARSTEGGILYTAPIFLLWTAKGYGKQARNTAAVAALVDEPTTTALATLFNNESGGGKHYVIERAIAYQDVSGSAESRWALWLCVHPVGMTAPTNDITSRYSTSGLAEGGSLAMFDNGATVVDNGWFPWTDSKDVEPTGVLGGGAVIAEIAGRIILPPQAGLSAHVVASTVDEDFTIGFHWYEVPENELNVV